MNSGDHRMKVICRPRRSGKTTELIKYASENNLYIVCPDLNFVRQIADKAKELNIDINYPITFREFLNYNFSKQNIKGFCIDNADMLLSDLARGIKIKSIVIDSD